MNFRAMGFLVRQMKNGVHMSRFSGPLYVSKGTTAAAFSQRLISAKGGCAKKKAHR
jgi:hypothetical protein